MHVGLVDLKWRGHHTPYAVLLTRYFTGNGHQVTFITSADHPALDEFPDSAALTVVTLDPPVPSVETPGTLLSSVYEQGLRVAQLRRIYRAAIDEGVDVVHLLYFDRTQIPFRLATKTMSTDRPPTVATLHRDAFLDNSQRSTGKAFIQTATTWALSSALGDESLSTLTVHASSIRDRIIGAVPAAVCENVRVIAAPTPEISVDVTQSGARDYLDLPTDRRMFLFFGPLRHEKGPDVLAAALEDVDSPVTVVFAGSGDDFTQSDVDRWGRATPDAVDIDGRLEYIPEDDVEYYFVAADALVLPYRRRRGISGPLRRAAFASTPVIGNSCSDVGDLIERHELGWTFDDREELTAILNSFDSHLAALDREALEAYARTQHWSRTGEQLVDIYGACLAAERTGESD